MNNTYNFLQVVVLQSYEKFANKTAQNMTVLVHITVRPPISRILGGKFRPQKPCLQVDHIPPPRRGEARGDLKTPHVGNKNCVIERQF